MQKAKTIVIALALILIGAVSARAGEEADDQ